MQKGLKPLKKIKDKYDEDMFEVLVREMLNVPEIKHTKEIQRCFQAMAHEYSEATYPKRLSESTKCRRRLAPKLWQWFVSMYPRIADYFCGVEYKMSGGFGDPRGRYILTPKGELDDWSGEWLAGPYNRHLDTVIKEKIIRSKRSISRRGMLHQTFTKINRDSNKLEQLQRQVQTSRNPTKVYLHRLSSFNGFREFCAQHGCTAENPPSVYRFQENDITHLAFCYSARKGDILEHSALLNMLLGISPTELIFETADRVGREYADDTIKLLESIGFKVTIENKNEKYETGWQHPYKSDIQLKNKALNCNYLVPKSHIKAKWRNILKRTGNHFVCNRSVANQLCLVKNARTLLIEKYDNLIAQIKTLTLSNDTNTYYISSA